VLPGLLYIDLHSSPVDEDFTLTWLDRFDFGAMLHLLIEVEI